MNHEETEKLSWKEKLRNPYRVVIMQHETLEEVASYRLTLLNIYILLSVVFVVLTTLVVLLIAFTPLRRYVPGYADASSNKELMAMKEVLDELEAENNAQRLYIDNVRRQLLGEVVTEEDVEEGTVTLAQDSLGELPQAEIDAILRTEAENQRMVGMRAQDRSTLRSGSQEVRPEQLYYTPPVSGEISAGFLPEKMHYGVDVLAPKNTAVKAAMDGYVFFSDWTLETGNTIGIQHANHIITFYKHNSALLKKAGSFVRAGEAVAIIGNTGTMTDGPHLHFELWHKGKPIDPTQFIQF